MRKSLSFLFLFFFLTVSHAQTREETISALNDLSKKVMFKDPYKFKHQNYAELAYLKRTFGLPFLTINDSIYISRLNDYYYKRLYPYRKLLDENAVVAEDCFFDDANDKVHPSFKLMMYSLYPSVPLPADIIEKIDQYATLDEFFGPFRMLHTIYFLKKYRLHQLSKKQKDKLADTEKFLSKLLYTKYVENKPWEFHRFLSVQVLKMNNNDLVKDIDISDLVKYFNDNGALQLGQDDTKNTKLIQSIGAKEMMHLEINAVLWIFLLTVNKI